MVHRHEPEADELAPAYAGRLWMTPIPKNRMPDIEAPAQSVYRLIHDELLLDGSSRLNMATFVTTWMEPEADRLMAETFDKNMIDKDEYPQTAEIERRCVNIVADLFNAPTDGDAVGVSTIGSSEAVMLGGLAMKWSWRARQEAAGQPTDRPNMVLGSNVQVVWEKFCRYWDVEPRYVPVDPRPLRRRPRRRDGARRREHDRRDPDPRHDLHRRVRADQGDPRSGRRAQRGDTGRTSRSTSTRPAAGSWRRSCTPTSSGTSGSRR